ncbi:MAG: 3-methyl-2-oxobutanoate hydroxymethyltransferase [Oligoflexales bacterium]|nr:3-methyl-2-oxobutanoate hydroxymethyltransferase [Oligoflexales bacterium]
MSRHHGKEASNSVITIQKAKHEGRKLSMVTCYDASFARLVDRSGIDIVLVGDSLGNVIMGHEDTTQVTMNDMLHHSKAVSRVLRKPLLCVDMPFLSYQISPEQALDNAGRLIQQGGAQCVKLEGGRNLVPQVKKLVQAGIPVMGHLGLTPQKINTLGGYRIQGREEEQQKELIADAKALEDAGVFALVLELVPSELAKTVTDTLSIPTIGIGAGGHCDGQVLVLQDLLGFDEGFEPKFLKKYANLGALISESLARFDQEVKDGVFPSADHSFL